METTYIVTITTRDETLPDSVDVEDVAEALASDLPASSVAEVHVQEVIDRLQLNRVVDVAIASPRS